MSAIALTNAYCYVHAHNFTCDTNQLALNAEAATLDRTTFCHQGWTTLAGGGLKSGTFSMGGFWQSAASDAVDPQAYADLGVADRVFTFGPQQAEGGVAYLWQGGHFTYNLLGTIGELAPFTLEARSTGGAGVVRGQLAAAAQSVDATGVLGSVVNLGAVAAGQHLYATVHVLGTPGTSISLDIESDDSAGFASPTVRASIGPLAAAGGMWVTPVPGPITDTHWRLDVSSITGEFTVAAALAVQ
ncbi:hypothetical protein HNP84_000227 [Thermocatellispora tengchongensis]|uniref:Uncharacterized protein n=1 Tax=Thermocatellispora tengchongensis TaxID=1073253 RepID=A0A840NUQ8_9ACTN|nr:hypothetical protein [Thermocatellispora tengchongensis]MBB5130539.1 hypothetical protein [Thermocatellispora tengchongensis]